MVLSYSMAGTATTIYKDKVDTFYKGKSPDSRLQDSAMHVLATGLDIFTHPKRLTPFPTMIEDDTKADMIVLTDYANTVLWGLGLVSSTAHTKIFRRSSALTDAWSAASSGASGSGQDSRKVFKDFHDYLYSVSTDVGVLYYGDITGGSPGNGTASSFTCANTAQAFVTSDDLLLIPHDNKIAVKDGKGSGPTDAWTNEALVLPDDRIIVDIEEIDANTVAIATKSLNGQGRSLVYLWDKVDTDPSDVIDFGEGDLELITLIGQQLIGISATNALFGINPLLIVRGWASGHIAELMIQIPSENALFTLYGNHTKFRKGDKIFFGLRITIEGTTYHQIACVGRADSGYPIAFSLAQLINNETAINSIEGISALGDLHFCAFNDDGSMNRETTSTNASQDGTFITQKINGEALNPDFGRQWKTLRMAGILCVGMPENGEIDLYMRKDAETDWALVREYTTEGGMGFEAGTLDQATEAGADFGKCKEFQFKAVCTEGSGSARAELIAVLYGFEVSGGDVLSAA